MLVTSFSAPPAVCASEMPSLALLTDWVMPLICDVIVLVIARPAALSAALLIFMPVESCSIACEVIDCAESDALAASMAEMLVLITVMAVLHVSRGSGETQLAWEET